MDSPKAGVLLVTKSDPDAPAGGRELLYRLNHDCLQSLFGKDFHCHRLSGGSPRGLRNTLRALRGYIDGVDRQEIGHIVRTVRESRIRQVFLDGSNLGQVAHTLRRQCPDVVVHSFFHNVEARFFLGALRARKTPRALAVLIANYMAERAAVRHSDVIICLSRRDSALLVKLYGRSADHIAPIALIDRLPAEPALHRATAKPTYLLFVGGAFYANSTGIAWFVRNVSPHIDMTTCIVGRGLEDLALEFAVSDKVKVVGTVDDLAPWYSGAYAVVAPIFDGSGMKTKIAEALMFGKKVIGTPEAFSGYEEVAAVAGWQCVTVKDFVVAIEKAVRADLVRFDLTLRHLYEAHYSLEAGCGRLARIIAASKVVSATNA